MTIPFTIEHPRRNVCLVTVKVNSWSDLGRVRFLLGSDAHWDNPDCNQALLAADFQEAKDTDAGIFHFGDFYCAMQGKWDPRASAEKLRPEHRKKDYLGALTRTGADWLQPYAANLALLGDGNHETAIQGRQGFDLLAATVAMLRDRAESPVGHGGYTGWVAFRFRRHTEHRTIKLWYSHGWGGGGQVTQNMIQAANRMLVQVGEAHIIATGHVHRRWAAHMERAQLSQALVPYLDPVWVVQCGTYKDEYGAGEGGWAVERGHGPRALGGHWLTFYEGERGPAAHVEPTKSHRRLAKG